MSHFEETISIDVPDGAVSPVERLSTFYRHNGYGPDGDDVDHIFVRGESGAGWLSSKMTDLATELTIEVGDKTIVLTYRVETTGQHLTDEDRAFWKREADAAESYLRGDEELLDLRLLEEERAKNLRSELRGVGLWAMGIVFVIVFVVGIVGDRLGYL